MNSTVPSPSLICVCFVTPPFPSPIWRTCWSHIATFTVLLLVPYYLLNTYQTSALVGGVFLAMAPLGTMLAAPLGGWLLSRYASHHLSLCGLCLVSAGLLGISQWHAHTTTALIVGMLGLQGFGLGLFQVANMDFVMGLIPRHQQGVAGSLTMLTRTVGVAAGATLGSFLLGVLQARYTMQLEAAGVSVAGIESASVPLRLPGGFSVCRGDCCGRWSVAVE